MQPKETTKSSLEVILPKQDPIPEREKWTKLEFYLINIGATVGISSVWRFSYLMFEDGGGVFLLLFMLTSAVLSQPCVTMLIAVSQSFSKGLLGSYDFSPETNGKRLWGLAMTKVLYTLVVVSYYNYLSVYNLIFLTNTIFTKMPWMQDPPQKMLHSLSKYFQQHIIMANSSEGESFYILIFRGIGRFQNETVFVQCRVVCHQLPHHCQRNQSFRESCSVQCFGSICLVFDSLFPNYNPKRQSAGNGLYNDPQPFKTARFQSLETCSKSDFLPKQYWLWKLPDFLFLSQKRLPCSVFQSNVDSRQFAQFVHVFSNCLRIFGLFFPTQWYSHSRSSFDWGFSCVCGLSCQFGNDALSPTLDGSLFCYYASPSC